MVDLQTIHDYFLQAEHEVEHYLITDKNIDIVEALPVIFSFTLLWGVASHYYQDESKYFVATFHSVMLVAAGVTNLYLGHNELEHYAFYAMSGYFLSDLFLSKWVEFYPHRLTSACLQIV